MIRPDPMSAVAAHWRHCHSPIKCLLADDIGDAPHWMMKRDGQEMKCSEAVVSQAEVHFLYYCFEWFLLQWGCCLARRGWIPHRAITTVTLALRDLSGWDPSSWDLRSFHYLAGSHGVKAVGSETHLDDCCRNPKRSEGDGNYFLEHR